MSHARAPVDTIVGDRVVRFDRVERVVHWVTAVPMLVLAVTGLILYVGPLSSAVGRRDLLRDLHILAGMMLAVPLAVALLTKHGSGLRRDIDRVANWHDDDIRWFRPGRARRGRTSGKFNGGQKANTIFVGAAIVVMLGTGSIMKWFGPFPLAWRTGATFVHDWFAIVLWAALVGHIVLALVSPRAMRSMWTGWVRLDDVEQTPRWRAELVEDSTPDEGRR